MPRAMLALLACSLLPLASCSSPGGDEPADPLPATEPAHEPLPMARPRPKQGSDAPVERDLEGVTVHLSIDDMPWQIERDTTMPIPPAETLRWNLRLVSTLAGRDITASVFFVCERVQIGANTIELWRDQGHTVGNHTWSHLPLAEVGVDAFLADLNQCHDMLHGRLEAKPTWFRYPYLGHGDGPEAQQAVREGLRALGYRNAPVSVATTEWMYAYAYRRAVGKPKKRAEIVEDWHRHMDEALQEARRLAQATQGREIPQVVLVHMNELVTDHLREVIDRWRARGVRFVDLQTAMADPVYSLEPQYTGRSGISWLVRVADAEHRSPYWFREEERRVVERFGPMPVRGKE